MTKKSQVEEAQIVEAQTETQIAQVPAVPFDPLAARSPEERAEILALTGQDSVQRDRVPHLKVNYLDIADIHGNTIKKGNFVFNQSSKTVEIDVVYEDGETITEDRAENLGVDLGRSTSITVLAVRQQYAFYHEDANLKCSSQIFGNGEVPVGNKLGYDCRGGKCPRRQPDLDKKEKCTCSNVVMCLVDIENIPTPALLYVKGSSYMPFQEYLKSAGQFPLPYAPTKIKTKQEKNGSVTYFTVSFDLETQNVFPPEIRERNKQLAKDAISGMEDYKAQQKQKSATKQLVDKSEGQSAKLIAGNSKDDDDICFD